MRDGFKKVIERPRTGENTARKIAQILVPAGYISLLIMSMIGCGESSIPQKPPSAKPAEAKVPAPVPVAIAEAKPETPVTAPPPFIYSPENRRDPFRSILVTTEAGKMLENLPPLQRTEIGELRLIAVVWGGFGYSAMVQTPDGKGYTIRVGTLVGPNKGKVKIITERYLTVEERYTDIFGEKKTREVKLDLYPQKEGSE